MIIKQRHNTIALILCPSWFADSTPEAEVWKGKVRRWERQPQPCGVSPSLVFVYGITIIILLFVLLFRPNKNCGFSFTIQSFNPTFYAVCFFFFTTHSIVFYYSIQNVKMISQLYFTYKQSHLFQTLIWIQTLALLYNM